MKSLVAPPFVDPDRAFVEVGRNIQQHAAEKIKAEPKNANTNGHLDNRQHPRERTAGGVSLNRQFAQAIRADDTVIVFRDAFATIKMPALGTPRDRFAQRMLKATLVNKRGHYEAASEVVIFAVRAARCSGVTSPCAAVISGTSFAITFFVARNRVSGGNS